MSLKGFKRNEWATRAAKEYGWLTDPRSFISQPKVIAGECDEPQPHWILYGEDKSKMRAEIFRRNRLENGNTNRCWKCGKELVEDAAFGDPARGEWDHPRNKPGERCDCPENGRVACSRCHSKRHPKPQWSSAKSTESLIEMTRDWQFTK